MLLICPATYDLRNSTKKLALRDWPLEYWINLIGKVEKHGIEYRIVVTKELSKKFTKFKNKILFANSLEHLFAIIDSAKLVLTQDSGFMHIARFKKTKVIALFGPTDPEIFTQSEEIIIRNEKISCSPCHDGRKFSNCSDNICMKTINPEDVFSVVLKNLEDFM